jgi:hypothetical protein
MLSKLDKFMLKLNLNAEFAKEKDTFEIGLFNTHNYYTYILLYCIELKLTRYTIIKYKDCIAHHLHLDKANFKKHRERERNIITLILNIIKSSSPLRFYQNGKFQ